MASQRSLLIFALCFASTQHVSSNFECSKHTLSLLNIIFRHGNKTQEGTYPTDLYQNETYYPFGNGQLTDEGKRLGYHTGMYLRKKYNKFLGTYSPEVLEAYTSPYPRCKSYLQLITASLYPPSKNARWHPDLNWQPISYNDNCTLTTHLFWTYISCPNFGKTYRKHKKSNEYNKVIGPYKETIKYLERNSGLEGKDYVFGTAIFLYATFLSQEEWGLKLPPWTDKIWPEIMKKIAAVEWTQVFETEETRIMGAGFLMSKIIKDINLHINRNPSVKNRKVYLYVGHDTNIYAVLAWLDVLKPIIASYGSYIIFEIHNVAGNYYVKILYQNDEDASPVPIRIPNCGYCCPINDFMNFYSARLQPERICN